MLSFVVPTRNSQAFICNLVGQINELGEHLLEEIEICLVDDASSDGTIKRIKDYVSGLTKLNVELYVYQNFIRLGQQRNSMVALRASNGSTICLIEDDMVLNKRTLDSMLNCLRSDNTLDLVVGTQEKGERINLTSYLFWRVLKILSRGGIPKRELLFRIFNRESLTNFLESGNQNLTITENCNRLYYQKTYLELTRIEYVKGTSRHSFWHRFKLATEIYLRFAKLQTTVFMSQVFLMLIASIVLLTANTTQELYDLNLAWYLFTGLIFLLSGSLVLYNLFETTNSRGNLIDIPKPKLVFKRSMHQDV
jgi:glycosyltransferase involved in cell wall biosynthesis